MAIKTIPSISGPSFGGVIYGMTMSSTFSTSPSKLILNIVNETGTYSTPSLNSRQSVQFGGFNFNGIVWSYSFNNTSDERSLEVQLIDNSIQLDRKHVVLWKRGLLGKNGTSSNVSKEINLSDESTLVPMMQGSPYPYLDFKEVQLGKASVSRTVYSQSPTWVGDTLLLGKEKWPDSKCDIPDTYYTFNDLKSAFPFAVRNAPSNSTLQATYEGSLREVISSWCADLGYDFFWDYSNDSLYFYNVAHGISQLPLSVQTGNVISRTQSSSLEGTYKQYAVAYTARPKEPLKELSASKTLKSTHNATAVNISYFLNRAGKSVSLTGNESGKYYGNRTLDEILTAAMVGYVSRPLRDFFCYSKGQYNAIGIQSGDEAFKAIDKAKTINLLKKIGYADSIVELEKFDGVGLPGFVTYLGCYDTDFADKLVDLEQDLLTKIGKWYRMSSKSSSFYYCSSKAVAEVDISVDPEGTIEEPDSSDFAGKRMFNRQGEMSNDSSFIQEKLKLESRIDDIQNCTPVIVDLKESGALSYLVNAKILTEKSRYNAILLLPTVKLITSKIGLTVSLSTGNNDLEKTWSEIRDGNAEKGQKACPDYEKRIEDSQCTSAKDEARQKLMKQINSSVPNQNDSDFVSGLVAKTAKVCTISLSKGGSASFASPSYAPYRVVTTVNVDTKMISTLMDTRQFLFSNGTIGTASDVAELRVAIDNQTDSGEDFFQKKRTGEIVIPQNVDASSPTQSVTYKFAGAPEGVNLSPSNGLSSLDVSLTSEGFTTSVTFSTRSPKPAKNSSVMRQVHSQFNRTSFNAS
jgi:hypothetical protein